ncbi:MAG: YadA C-terminal domain-containing protein, partial [Bacteroidales bacterium]
MSSAFAATSHNMWEGATDKFTGTITSKDRFEDLIKYTDYGTQAKLRASFKDGTLTAAEIKESGIKDYHFYTGYLSSAKTQGEYDKYMKQLQGGSFSDDNFISNRDLKASNSMVMNQVDTKLQVQSGLQNQVDVKQDKRVDKIVEGLKELGNHLTGPVNPSLPDGGQEVPNPPAPPVENNKPYDDTQVKNDIATNSGNIQAMGDAFEKRVDVVNDYLSQAGNAINSNTTAISDLNNAFQAQAAHTTQEIARLDGRIDSLEKKTDKLKAGVAGANAIGSLTQYTGNGTHHVAVGIGGYEGASALAGGYTYAISAQTTVRAT